MCKWRSARILRQPKRQIGLNRLTAECRDVAMSSASVDVESFLGSIGLEHCVQAVSCSNSSAHHPLCVNDGMGTVYSGGSQRVLHLHGSIEGCNLRGISGQWGAACASKADHFSFGKQEPRFNLVRLRGITNKHSQAPVPSSHP